MSHRNIQKKLAMVSFFTRMRMKRMRKDIWEMGWQGKLLICFWVLFFVVGGVLGAVAGTVVTEKKVNRKIEAQNVQYEKEIKTLKKEVREAENKVEAAWKNAADAVETTQSKEVKELPWNLVLVNGTHEMAAGYVPEIVEIQPGYSVDVRIAEAANQMLAAAQAEGMQMVLCSAYRTMEEQKEIFTATMEGWIAKGYSMPDAYKETSKSVAVPGTSEHSMGLALDIVSAEYGELDDRQAETKEAKWLAENGHKYGFILRYPPEKIEETGIIYEPWHYRYVGTEDATRIVERGVTLEQYLDEEGYRVD